MAERRMFSKTITQSARFLKLPATARALYYDLGMAADDDGVVEAFAVMRMTGATNDDLEHLIGNEFIVPIDEENDVVYILDWRLNNYIQKDRYHKSIYYELLKACGFV